MNDASPGRRALPATVQALAQLADIALPDADVEALGLAYGDARDQLRAVPESAVHHLEPAQRGQYGRIEPK